MPGFPLGRRCLPAACPAPPAAPPAELLCISLSRTCNGAWRTVRYDWQHLVPLLVEQCVDFIRVCGLTEERLFRLPGQATLVKDPQDSFDGRKKPQFDRYKGHFPRNG